jgi:acetyltransferase
MTSATATTSVASRIHSLLNPTSIAVVGASESSIWASELVANILRWDFPGSIHMVHPTKTTVFDRPAYPSLDAVPTPIDHALIVVRAALVPGILRECGELGIRSATVIAAGFAEAGAHGASLAAEVVDIADTNGISLIGPNCYGFTNYPARAVITRNWVEEEPTDLGAISLIFQSGQLNLSAVGSAHQRGIDLRYAISSGNELVTNANDYFEYFLEDAGTRVLGGGLERIPEPRRFERVALRALELGKPIVLLKLGVSEAGSRIAKSHTGSVAGDARIVRAFLSDLGVVVVDDIDELVETAGLLAERGWPKGARTVFLGGSGGSGEFFADMADGTNVDLVDLDDGTLDQVSALASLPASSLHNPMDLTASGFGNLAAVAGHLAASGEVDIVIAQGEEPLSTELQGESMVAAFRSHAGSVRSVADHGVYGVFVSSTDRAPTEFGKRFRRDEQVSYLRGPVGVRALSNAIAYGRDRDQGIDRVRAIVDARSASGARRIEVGGASSTLSEAEAKSVLAGYGIRVSRDVVARSVEAAIAAADEIGYPVVLKVDSPAIAHKSEIGGVVTGIEHREALIEAHAGVLERARAAYPGVEIDSVLVCEQIVGGTEIIVGAVADEAIGSLVLVGAGGVFVEVFEDVALAVPPVSIDRARDLIRSLRIAPILEGARGREPVDLDALAAVVAAVSELVIDLGEQLGELDVNPVIATAHGAVVADALIVLEGAS